MVSMQDTYRNVASSIPYHNDTYPYISPRNYAQSLVGQVVLVTGAGKGIGRATALAFASAGASVACLARTRSDLDTLVAEILDKGAKAIAIEADVRAPAAPRRAVQQIESTLGPITILINNAGSSRISDLEHEVDMAKAWDVVETNMRGTMAFTQAVLHSARVIINVVSVLANISLPYFSAYSAAKAGIIRYTHIVALELREKGICIFAVHPGMIADTNLGSGALNMEAHRDVGAVQDFVREFGPSMTDSLALPANTFVALSADPLASCLSGKYIDCTQDLGAVLKEASKGAQSAVEKAGLYVQRIDVL